MMRFGSQEFTVRCDSHRSGVDVVSCVPGENVVVRGSQRQQRHIPEAAQPRDCIYFQVIENKDDAGIS
jgi:hypothetical protein